MHEFEIIKIEAENDTIGSVYAYESYSPDKSIRHASGLVEVLSIANNRIRVIVMTNDKEHPIDDKNWIDSIYEVDLTTDEEGFRHLYDIDVKSPLPILIRVTQKLTKRGN